MRRVLLLVGSLAVVTGAMLPVRAQDALPRASWGLHGGMGFPVGPSEGLGRGYQWTAFADVPWSGDLRALRVEVVYGALPFPAASVSDSLGQPVGDMDGTVRVRALTLNLIVRRSHWSLVRPYLAAGAGVFRISYRTEGPRAEVMTSPVVTRVGGNVGLGFETSLGRVTVFGEARFHTVLHGGEQEELQFVPATLGLRVR